MKPIETKIAETIQSTLKYALELKFLDITNANCQFKKDHLVVKIQTGSRTRTFSISIDQIGDSLINNTIMQNENYKMLKISNTKYKILDKNDNLVLGVEGKNYTKEELEEQFNNCLKNCIFI